MYRNTSISLGNNFDEFVQSSLIFGKFKQMRIVMKRIYLIFFMLLIFTSYGLTQGETCATAISLSLGATYTGTTCGSGNDYTLDLANPNLCNANNQEQYINFAEDLVFTFTAPDDACYNFSVPTGNSNNKLTIHIFETCPDDPLTVVCLGWDILFEPFPNFPIDLSIPISAGQTVYVVVSGETGCYGPFDLTVDIVESDVENDLCINAIELQEEGSNIGATDCGEPDEWSPEYLSAYDCPGGVWTTMENGVWYTITIDEDTPSPFSITIENVSCTGGAETLQMGLWENIGNCTLSPETLIDCVVGIGTVSMGPFNLAYGDYHLFIDGNAGADCTWEFDSELLCQVGEPTPDSYGPYCSGDVITTTLTAVPSDVNNVINWYDGDPENGGVFIATGNTITTPPYITNTPGIYEIWVTEYNPIDDCESEAQVIIIEVLESPTATLSGSGSVCEGSGDLIDLTLVLTGAGPWDVVIAVNGVDQSTVTFTTSPQIIQAGEGETITISYVSNDACDGITSGSVTIGTIEAPTAELTGSGSVCEGSGDLIDLTLILSGTGPWVVVIAIDGVDQPEVTYTTSPQIIQAGEGETITITSVTDALCDGSTTGSITIGTIEAPTAELTGSGEVCEGSGDLIDLTLVLTGTGPWDVVYAINGIDQPVITYISSPQIIQAGEGETITISSVTDVLCDGTTLGTVTIGTITAPTAELTGSGEVCEGSGDLVDLTLILTGTGPWDVVYAIDGVDQPVITYTSSPQIIQAGEGETITITSVTGSGCDGTTSGSITIGTIEAPTAEISGSGSVCEGSGDLVDLILELSGTGPWDVIYAIDGIDQPVITYNSSPQIIQAGEGETITITSIIGAGCEGITFGSITIGSIEAPTAEISGSGSVCEGSGDQVDLILELSGTGPWDVIYAIDGVDQPEITYTSSPQIILAGEGETITITYVSDDLCEGITYGSVTIGTIEAPTAGLTGSGAICTGSGGILNLTLSMTGTGPWDVIYSINGINQPQVSFNNSPQMLFMNEGETFSLISVIGSGCSGTVNTNISVDYPDPPFATIFTPDPLCNNTIHGSEINLDTLIINGDSNGYWEDTYGSGVSGTLPIIDFDGLPPNTYTFTYTTSSAVPPCEDVGYPIMIIVEDCDCPSIAIMPPNAICNDLGIIDLSNLQVTGEPGTWSITSEPGLGNPATITGNSLNGTGADPGQYELTFTLDNTPPLDCDKSSTVTLIINDAPDAIFGSSVIVCGEPGNIVDLSSYLDNNPGGGIWTVESGIIPSSFEANTGTFDAYIDSGGPYIFTYTIPADLPCDPSVAIVSIEVSSPLTAGTGGSFDYCNSEVDLINLQSLLIDEDLGGTWTVITNNDDPGSFDALNATFNPIGHKATTLDFLYEVSGDGICPPVSQIISINITDQPSADLITIDTVCNTSPGVTILDFSSLINSGNEFGIWIDQDGSGAEGVFPILDFDGVPDGSYNFIYTISADLPCEPLEIPVQIVVEKCECPSVDIDIPAALCNADGQLDLGTLQITPEPGIWSISSSPPGTNPAVLTGSSFDATAADKGQYKLTFTIENEVPQGCPSSSSVIIQVEDVPNAGLDNNLTSCNDLNTILNLNTLLSNGISGGVWAVEESPIPAPGTFDPITGLFTVSGLDPGHYPFKYTVAGVDPCPDDIASFEVTIEFCENIINDIYLPNIFTPNNDGLNDFFLPSAKNVEKIEFSVYNRWGSLVFISNDINQGWDGTFRGKRSNVGVYVYHGSVEFQNGETRIFSGDVTLIR